MRMYSSVKQQSGLMLFPWFTMTLFLIAAWIPGICTGEAPPEHAPPSTNPHASPPGPNTPLPSGIVGLALHITAGKIGDPAQLIIRAVHPSGPAAQAGLTHGEEILTINDIAVTGKTHQETVGLIRGEVGTSVKLGLRGPQGERTVSLVRVSDSLLMEHPPQDM
jgi:hypothetical protein